MKKRLMNAAAGTYLLFAALILGVAATVSYLLWGAANYATDSLVAIALCAGAAVNLLLLFADSDYLIVVLTALYSVGLVQLLADNAGSFADAYQGIVMFGDPTQVGALLTMAALLMAGIAAVIAAGFTGCRKV